MNSKIQSNLGSRQGGFTLLEMVAAVTVLGAVVLGSASLINQSVDDTKSSVASLYMKTVSTAANQYIHDNFATVYQNATASTVPIVIPLTTLRNSNHLPSGFSLTNPYGQSPCVIVKSPSANNLVALLATEGGADIDDITLAQIAGGVGSAGGAIYNANPNEIRGTMGGWSFNKTEFTGTQKKCDGVTAGTVALDAKRPAVALWIAEGSAANATLYRNAVPSNPTLNTMETPIIMGAGTQQTEGGVCGTVGMLGRTSTGVVLSCDGTNWKRQASAYWSDPVLNFAALPAAGDNVGSVRMTLDNKRAFMFTGTAWASLAVDENGNMTVPNTLTANTVTANSTVNAANGKFSAYEEPGQGGLVRLIGANGQKMFLQNINGRLRLINDPWTNELLSVDQAGNMGVARDIVAGNTIATKNYQATMSEVAGEGGLLTLTGSNGQKMYVENVNGVLRVINNPWNRELFKIDQNGNTRTDGNAHVVGTVTAQGDVIANGNISSGQTLAGAYAQLTVTSNVGGGCSPEGLISRNANGQLLVCEASQWTYAAKQFSGETCGMMTTSGNGTLCQGYDPRFNCPDGYYQIGIGLGAENLNYCSKG